MTTTPESQRDELARTLMDASSQAMVKNGSRHWPNMADAVLAAGYRKPTVITSEDELERELIVKSASYLDAFYLPSPGAPFRNVVTGAWVTLTELNMRGDFFPVTVLWDPEA